MAAGRCRDLCVLFVEEWGLVSCSPPSSPAAHLGTEARSLQYGTDLAVLKSWQPLQVSSGDLEHALAVFIDWAISSLLCSGKCGRELGGASVTLLSFVWEQRWKRV